MSERTTLILRLEACDAVYVLEVTDNNTCVQNDRASERASACVGERERGREREGEGETERERANISEKKH